MVQVMLGAMVQILPVVAGANMARPLWVSGVVHAALTVGALFLVAAFLSFIPYYFAAAAVFLGAGTAIFIGSAANALYGIPSTSPTIIGLKLALVGLAVTVVLGVVLSLALAGRSIYRCCKLADIHLGWVLSPGERYCLAAVGYCGGADVPAHAGVSRLVWSRVFDFGADDHGVVDGGDFSFPELFRYLQAWPSSCGVTLCRHHPERSAT